MRQSDPVVTCEACGETQQDMVDDLRRFKLLNPGKSVKLMMASLRSPFWCERCIATVATLIKAARVEAGDLGVAGNGAREDS